MAEVIVSLENIQKSFTIRNNLQRVVLNNLHMQIFDNDFISISGPSGSGKTTLLRIIIGDLPVNSGQISFSYDIIKSEKIAYSPQEPKLRSYLTVEENLLEVSFNHERVQFLLESLRLERLRGAYKDELSCGELGRASMCKALMNDPKLLLLDEPTANLDKKSAEITLSFIESLFQIGKTIVIVSHSKLVRDYTKKHYTLASGSIELIKKKHGDSVHINTAKEFV